MSLPCHYLPKIKTQTHLCLFLFLFLFFLSLALPAQVEQSAEKQEGKHNTAAYQMGVHALRRADYQKARQYFQESITEGGQFSDNARLELVQLMAAKQIKGNGLEAIRKVLNSFKDEEIAAEAWITASQTLAQNLRSEEALELAQELYLRFPASDYADEALLLSAHILYYEHNSPASALERLYTCLKLYPQMNIKLNLYALLAEIYLSPESSFYNISRACRFLKLYDKESKKLGINIKGASQRSKEKLGSLCSS